MTSLQILNQSKSTNWCSKDATLIKLYVHHFVMLIHNYISLTRTFGKFISAAEVARFCL